MKKLGFLLILGLLLAAVVSMSCGKKEVAEEIPVEPEPKIVEDTTPPPPPPPPPPAPTLKESQFVTVYFDFDKYNLLPDAKKALETNYNLLTEFNSAIIKIGGHCDERGTVEYNLSLGEKRARSAMDYLIDLGVTPKRISIISYGKERPIDPGHNKAAWSKNRRCEFRVISQ